MRGKKQARKNNRSSASPDLTTVGSAVKLFSSPSSSSVHRSGLASKLNKQRLRGTDKAHSPQADDINLNSADSDARQNTPWSERLRHRSIFAMIYRSRPTLYVLMLRPFTRSVIFGEGARRLATSERRREAEIKRRVFAN